MRARALTGRDTLESWNHYHLDSRNGIRYGPDMLRPQISVIMPVYNAEAYLAASVGSILEQTVRELELIAINDGSTDASGRILKELAAKDGRIRLIQRGNRGQAATRNEAAALAQGEYLAWMDADDIAFPQRLERQRAFLQGHPDVVAVGSAIQYLTSGGLKPVWGRHPEKPAAIGRTLPRENCIANPSVMVRRAAFERVPGGFRTEFIPAEDYDLYLRLLEVGQIANLPEVLLSYRLHGGQVSHRQLNRQALAHLGTRTAYARRRAGESDRVTHGSITREQLEVWGVGAWQIEQVVLETVSGWIALLIKTGELARAEALLADEEQFRHPT